MFNRALHAVRFVLEDFNICELVVSGGKRILFIRGFFPKAISKSKYLSDILIQSSKPYSKTHKYICVYVSAGRYDQISTSRCFKNDVALTVFDGLTLPKVTPDSPVL